MASPVYETINRAWKSTCRVLFGQEAGELEGTKNLKWDIFNIGAAGV